MTLTAVVLMGLAGRSANGAPENDLRAALSSTMRAASDRERDLSRRPVETLAFLEIERSMQVIDLYAGDGYFTEVLALAVGPGGKVYSHNPPEVAALQNGRILQGWTQRLSALPTDRIVRVEHSLRDWESPVPLDAALTSLNFHDLYNADPSVAQAFLEDIHGLLKPGGVLGVIDHIGSLQVENRPLHRVPAAALRQAATAAGFIVEAESALLANPDDDHLRNASDPTIRGRTDRLLFRLRKPLERLP